MVTICAEETRPVNQNIKVRLDLLAATCWSPSVMEVTGDIPQVTADNMYPSGPTELLKFPCCRSDRLVITHAHASQSSSFSGARVSPPRPGL